MLEKIFRIENLGKLKGFHERGLNMEVRFSVRATGDFEIKI